MGDHTSLFESALRQSSPCQMNVKFAVLVGFGLNFRVVYILDLTLKRMYEPTERLALPINSWQVNANIFRVMGNVFLREFHFSL